jgi:glycine betaine/proline transport system substrate-binding protein
MRDIIRKKVKQVLISGVFLALIFATVSTAEARPAQLVDFSWDSSQVHNRIAGFILENGYDTEVEITFAESMPGLLGLERGDIDIMMECWVDNFHEWWEGIKDTGIVHNSGLIFTDVPQGWYVPDYVIYGDKERGIEPMAPDLESVFDLKKYWKLFESRNGPGKGRLYNGPVGWLANTINKEKLKTYQLDEYYEPFDPGSEAALSAAISSAYEKGEPILAYGWEPTAIMGRYDMIILKEPPYDKEIWEKNYGCGIKNMIAYILVNSEYAEENPEITHMLDRYTSTIDQMNKTLAYMTKNNAGTEEAAIWFLREYPEEWRSWVADETRIAKIEKALEEK